MSEPWTTLKLIQWTKGYFEKAGVPNPRLDAELLLAHLLKCKRIDLYTNHERTIAEKDLAKFKELIQRRSKREPLQYIIGETEFYGLKFKVTPEVLIPRPETELLVEEAIAYYPTLKKGGEGGFSVLDIGTGSGCIAITLAKNLPEAKITATDSSKEALEIAKENARRHEVDRQIEFLLSDIAPWRVFEAEGRRFDLIVSNPPYIPSRELESLQPEVRDFEPRKALDGGNDGLQTIRQILTETPRFLNDGAYLLLEIGEDQGKAIANLIHEQTSLDFQGVKKDLSGHDRISVAKKLQKPLC
ncbi:MAG: peptide chain release factor N(5)-glutamine methyltransferase [Deltaproteobacteria bacterium]|nr:peptide chain release factor N(5)-glutamine methyltransferase [Deltaproteobacteria bacterium]